MKTKDLQKLHDLIAAAEINLKAAKKLLNGRSDSSKLAAKIKDQATLSISDQGKIVEGIFDGENMLDSNQKIYPVPANYASKSKLIEGDKLKLIIASDGTFIFKQIGPIERKRITAELVEKEGEYFAKVKNALYQLLLASVTYYQAKPGDKIAIIVPSEGTFTHAVIDNVIEHDQENTSK